MVSGTAKKKLEANNVLVSVCGTTSDVGAREGSQSRGPTEWTTALTLR
jgi:hypothetical protein